MIVAFANNQTLVDAGDTTATVETDPHPVGDANYIEATFNIHSLFATGGSPSIKYQFEGSNDGQSWYVITALTETKVAAGGPTAVGADVTCAFVRVEFTLSSAGGNTDVVGTTFDLHANLTHK